MPVERCPGYTKRLTDFFHRCIRSVELSGNLDLLCTQFVPSPASSPSCSGSLESCLCSLPDNLPLELSQAGEDIEDQLSTGGCGVDTLGEALKANAPFLKISHGSNEMRQGAA